VNDLWLRAAGARRQCAPAALGRRFWVPLNFTVRWTVETPGKLVLLSVVAPPAAIILGALMQLGLITMWPQAQQLMIRHVSLDSYLVVAAMLLLSFFVGWSLRRRAPTSLALWTSTLAPAGWLVALLLVTHHQRFSLDALTSVYLGCATAPLLGVILGWMVGESSGARRPV
jgi:hypothetical protein